MALNAKNKEYVGGGNRVEQEALEPGSYPARVVQVIDLGVQEQQPYKGEPKPPAQELMVTYELTDEFIKDEDGNDIEDKPRWLSENFVLHNLESDLAKSTKRYYAIDPECNEDGDWTKLVGMPVMVTLVRNPGKGKNAGRTFNNIASTSVMRKKEADKLPELVNDAKVFDQDDLSTADIMLTFSDYVQKLIKAGLEWEGSAMANAVAKLNKKKAKDDAQEEDEEVDEKPAPKKAANKKPAKAIEKDADDTGEDW